MNSSHRNNILNKSFLFFYAAFLLFLPILGGLAQVNNTFHIAMFLGFLIIIYDRNIRNELFNPKKIKIGIILIGIFLAYFSLSNLWATTPQNPESELTHSIYILTFVMLFSLAVVRGKKNIMLALVLTATVILCFLSLLLVDKATLLTGRLQNGFSLAPENVIDMGGYYAIGMFCGLILIRETGIKWLYLPVAFLFVGLLLTQSRGPLLSFIVACLPLILLFKRVHLSHLLITCLVLGLLAFVVIITRTDHMLMGRMEMSYSQSFIRFGIWENALSYIQQKPWFGWGFNQEIDFVNSIGQRVHTTHSLYFASLLKGGIVGGLLLLSVIAYGLYMGWQQVKAGQALEASMLLCGVMFYATQGMFILSNPGVPWIMFWLPLSVVMALPKREQ